MTHADMFRQMAADRLAYGDAVQTREACLAGLRVDPDRSELHELLGLALYELEDLGPAVHHLESASALAPLSPVGQLALADLYVGFGLVLAATAVYEFLAEPDRCPTPLLADVARGLGRLGRYEAALQVCHQITARRPGYHPAWFGIAHYRRRLGRPLGCCISPLEQAFALAPHALTYRLNLAAAYAGVGRADDAYGLVHAVPAAAVRRPCLRRALAPVFLWAGDPAYLDWADPTDECLSNEG